MNRIACFYWPFMKNKIPFKYRKCKEDIIRILTKVEHDRFNYISITNIDDEISYNENVFKILECLHKYFYLKLFVSRPNGSSLETLNISYNLVDYGPRKEFWFDWCKVHQFSCSNTIKANFDSNYIESREYTSFVCNVPKHIVEDVVDRLSIQDKVNKIIRINEYDKLGICELSIAKIKQPITTVASEVKEDAKDLISENFIKCISDLIEDLEYAYNDDRRYLGESKTIKPTLIDCSKNNLTLNEAELKLIEILMFRRGYKFTWKYDVNEHFIISILALNNKDKRLKDIETMMKYVKEYGFKIEKLDLSSIENINDCNIIKHGWKGFRFNTIISELHRKYGSYLDL